MTSLLIMAHAPLASAMRQCVLHVFPDSAAHVAALDVHPNATPEDIVASAGVMLDNMPPGPTLIVTDVFGATPCNLALRLVDGKRTRLVTGVNLPMLLRCVTYRNEAIESVAARAVAGGTAGVMQVAPTAPQNQTQKRHDQAVHDHQQ